METINRSLSSAGLDPHSGPMTNVTETIRRALGAAGLAPEMPFGERGITIDGEAREIRSGVTRDAGVPPAVNRDPAPRPPASFDARGEFRRQRFANAAGSREYKLYIPPNYSEEPNRRVPLIVMLHGCTQGAEDFAIGTKMNELANRHGFLVAYPEQSVDANRSKCWNWFSAADQERDVGEPAILAGITQEIVSDYRIDPRRVFVAGMSAGAAMALILAVTYPEVYSAVGVHSGLPYGAAHDLVSAFGAMQRGGSSNSARARLNQTPPAIPTIVFHGDADRTVNPLNAEAIVACAVKNNLARPGAKSRDDDQDARASSYSRTNYVDASGRSVVEHWLLHGVGHTWSGGNPAGSFTVASGPDASAELIRFFFSQPSAGRA